MQTVEALLRRSPDAVFLLSYVQRWSEVDKAFVAAVADAKFSIEVRAQLHSVTLVNDRACPCSPGWIPCRSPAQAVPLDSFMPKDGEVKDGCMYLIRRAKPGGGDTSEAKKA
jgi:hypothetical protein